MTFLEENNDPEWSPIPVLISFITEIVGTTLLLSIGCAGCYDLHNMGPLLPGLAFAAAVMIGIQVTNHISPCHMNPAVTLGFLLMNQMHWLRFLIYIVGQYIGAMLGYTILWALTPTHNGMCLLKVEMGTELQAFCIELVGTMTLVLVVFGATDLKCAVYRESMYLRLASTVGGIVIAIATFTGCGINPARALPPAILLNNWKDQWLYQVGPLAGAAVAALLYRFVLSDTEPYSLNTLLKGGPKLPD